jgi:hypothetical protein
MASTENAVDDSYSAKAIEMLGLTDLFDEARRMTKRQVRWFVPGVLVSGYWCHVTRSCFSHWPPTCHRLRFLRSVLPQLRTCVHQCLPLLTRIYVVTQAHRRPFARERALVGVLQNNDGWQLFARKDKMDKPLIAFAVRFVWHSAVAVCL